MAELFQKGKSTINEHILNIYKEGELTRETSMRKIGISDFSTKPTNFYDLDVIISVGYRVKSLQGTKFRQWATARPDGPSSRPEMLRAAALSNSSERWCEALTRTLIKIGQEPNNPLPTQTIFFASFAVFHQLSQNDEICRKYLPSFLL
ncbi:MAG: RhuM family protein [Imperialibacter sp.]|uniref:RhuM family protein n=1 Tax=Imperialibacter sp. TaxID=2038411 RepID=UPI0032F03EC4